MFRFNDFRSYTRVNARFVDAVCAEVDTDSPVVFGTGLSLCAGAAHDSDAGAHARIVAFWHIPFPSPREWAACPWARPLLEGLLGSSIVGFQTRDDCLNFMHACEYLLHAHIAAGEIAVVYQGRPTLVRAYPSVGRVAKPMGTPVATCRALRRSSPLSIWAAGAHSLDRRRRSNGLHQGDQREVPGPGAVARVTAGIARTRRPAADRRTQQSVPSCLSRVPIPDHRNRRSNQPSLRNESLPSHHSP